MKVPAAFTVLMLMGAAGAACAAHQRPREHTFAAIEAAPPQESLSYQRSWQPDEIQVGAPEGATAKCRDGKYSFALERGDACRQHRGVEAWLQAL